MFSIYFTTFFAFTLTPKHFNINANCFVYTLVNLSLKTILIMKIATGAPSSGPLDGKCVKKTKKKLCGGTEFDLSFFQPSS